MQERKSQKSCIIAINSKTVEIPLKGTWKISYYAANTRPHSIIEIITEDGIRGYGEASPAPAFMGETAYTIDMVIQKYIKPSLIGKNIFDIEKIHDLMDESIYGNYAAKACIDMALYDAMGKTLQLPVYKLLGGKYRNEVDLSWVVGIKEDLSRAIEEAEHYVNLGYKTIKLKVGNSPEQDYQLVKAFRTYFGDKIKIRLDANQGYDYVTAIKLFKRLEEFCLESIEQPVKRWDIEGMKKVRESLDVPIMADESVSSFNEALSVVAHNAADIFNIKVGKVGGLWPAKKIATVVEAAGMHATAGSNLELGIGSAASIHFVASSRVLSYPNDLLLGIDLHQKDIVRTKFKVEDGKVSCPDLPGLGVEVDMDIFRG